MSTTVPERFALVNWVSARAIIYENRQPVCRIEISTSGEAKGPEDIPPGLSLGMWLQPAEAEPVDLSGKTDDELVQEMQVRAGLNRCIPLLSWVLDPKASPELRTEAARELEEYLQSPRGQAVEASYHRLLLVVEIPDGASTRNAPFIGRSKEIFDEAIAKWGHRPRSV